MANVPEPLQLLAEHSSSYAPLGPDEERIVTDRFVLWLGPGLHPGFNVFQRLRLAPDQLEDTLAEGRRLLRARGRPVSTWEVSSSATPPDLGRRLESYGLVPADEHFVVAMVLTEPPAPPPAGVVARPVESLAEFRTAHEIAWEGFGFPEEDRAAEAARLERAYEAELRGGPYITFLTFLDGEPVASAKATITEHGLSLNAGSTLPQGRGLGAYRALVAARWDEAVRRGTPALATQAGPMSRPILRRLGFREVAEVWIYKDELGHA
jgi:GNAT superfamily N-acetyltransferase